MICAPSGSGLFGRLCIRHRPTLTARPQKRSMASESESRRRCETMLYLGWDLEWNSQ